MVAVFSPSEHNFGMPAVAQASPISPAGGPWPGRTRCRRADDERRRPGAARHRCSAAGGDGPSTSSEELTSLQNPTVKRCAKLRTSRSARGDSGSALLCGADLVAELAPGVRPRALFFLRGDPPPPGAANAEAVYAVSEPVMRRLAGVEVVPAGMLAAEVALPAAAQFGSWRPGSLRRLLALEGIQDPGNLGTLLRTALALGWQGAVLLPGCADPWNDKALKAGRGAAFKLPLEAAGSAEALEQLAAAQGLACLAALPRPAGIAGGGSGRLEEQAAQLRQRGVCLVLGSEGRGVSAALAARCAPVTVPMAGEMESLNVAVAGGILMYEMGDRV